MDTAAKETETQHISKQENDELFVLDTTAVLPSKKQIEKKEKKKRKLTKSAKEEEQIKKLLETHSVEKLEEIAKTNTAKRARIRKDVDPAFDLWGDEKKAEEKKKSNAPTVNPAIGSSLAGTRPDHKKTKFSTPALPPPSTKKINLEVAESGQSYNPDKVHHEKVIESALEVEERRQKAIELNQAPISQGMSKETRAYLVGDSDTESESEEDNETDEKLSIQKKKEKLTRAQRNKQKRLRKEQKEIEQRKREKKLQKSVGEAKHISKLLRKEEADQREKAEALKKIKEESERTKGKKVYQQLAIENPIAAPTYPVALPSELKSGSLRTIKPKGSLITDRMASFLDRDMAPKKQLKLRKRVQGKRRQQKLKVRGKGFEATNEGGIMG